MNAVTYAGIALTVEQSTRMDRLLVQIQLPAP